MNRRDSGDSVEMSAELPTGFRDIRRVEEWLDKPSVEAPERRMLAIAHEYASTRPWMERITGYWHGLTVAGLVGVFLYRIVPPRPDIPEFHWIVVGTDWPYPVVDESGVDTNAAASAAYDGLPNAYIWSGYPDFADKDASASPREALESYAGVMGAWVAAARSGQPLDKLFPVKVPAARTTADYASEIARRIQQIEALPGAA